MNRKNDTWLRLLRLSSLSAASLMATAAFFSFGGDAANAASKAAQKSAFFAPGQGSVLPALVRYDNAYGQVEVLNATGPIETKGHPFFEPIGTNGRACVSCHQPANGMGLSVDTIRERWTETKGKDPLFAAIDGSN